VSWPSSRCSPCWRVTCWRWCSGTSRGCSPIQESRTWAICSWRW